MSDYKSKVHNAYFTANFVPMDDLRIFGSLAFNRAQASFDDIVMPHVEDRLDGDLEHQDFTFEETPTYSDLDFELINGQLGITYQLNPEVSWTTAGIYGNFWDYAPYVYGDESGSVFAIRSGFKVNF